ncbi:hypothetical protein [Micromonospora sp. b486]|nr:hypothetical protein [Micromonospora sp. b486]MDM4784620.1 hypothetical protein [Micromonospora sp. b486]
MSRPVPAAERFSAPDTPPKRAEDAELAPVPASEPVLSTPGAP